MEPMQSNSQHSAVEGTSELGKTVDPDSDSDWKWDTNSDSYSDSDTVEFRNDPGDRGRSRNELDEELWRLLRRRPLASEGYPNPQHSAIEGTSELGKTVEWDTNSDSDTVEFRNDPGDRGRSRNERDKHPWRLLRRRPLFSEWHPNPQHSAIEGTSELGKTVDSDSDSDWEWDTNSDSNTVEFRNDPGDRGRSRNELNKHLWRPLFSEGYPNPMDAWKRGLMKRFDKKPGFDRKAKASRASCAHYQNLIRSKINITGPSTQSEDDRTVYERIKQSAEVLNRTKDIVCLIISYPPMSLANGGSHRWNQYKWVRDILKINDVVKEMEAPSKKKVINAFKLENRISRLMTHYMDEIEPLFPQDVIAKSFSRIDLERHGQIIPMPKRVFDLAVDFAIREILQHIEYPEIRRIGISGSHGKTVISELRRLLFICDDIFDLVIEVDDFRCSSIEQIKLSIERKLFPSSRSGEQALDEKLKGTNFLILLHEVGERVNLYDMGANWWNSKKIQKIVYTAHSQNVDDITAVGVQITMENHLLSWELFCMNVGEVVHSSGILRLAINVVEECCGHLLAVVIMARALKEVNDVLIWEYASYTLGLQHTSQTKDRVLFNALAFMWGRLGSTNKYVKYCADMENWRQIEKVHLIDKWITIGLVGTFDEGEEIVGGLVNAFLLECFQYEDSDFVRMRREIHEELLNFLRFESCSPFQRLGGTGLAEPPKAEAWENSSEMHLMNNKVTELPMSPHGSQLEVLFLQSNHHLRAIPPIFFKGLPVLQILDLSYTRIRSLPQSLFELVQLRIFFLRGCQLLMELPPEVGKLRNLEVLNLEGTKIINLPIDVKRLKNLTCLKVSFHGFRKNQSSTLIPQNVIRKLFRLQELSIDVNPDDERWNATVEDIVMEVYRLEQLEALKLYLPQVALLDYFMWKGTLSICSSMVHFRFVVGSHHSRIISRLPHELAVKFELQERSLRYVNGEGIPSQIKEVLQHTTALFLDRHLTLTKLSEFGIGNMKKLEFCVLGECNKIETIVDGAENCKQEDDGENILQSLQFLMLHYMKNLVSIWKGPVWKGCLSSLKSLALHECPQLTTIFTLGLLENLNNLEELVVEWCPEINSIVTHEDPARRRPFPLRTYLPNLRKISLHYMPKLVNISSGFHIAPKLEWMSFYNCPCLETLSDMEVCSNNIKVIIGEADWWSSLKRSSYFGVAQQRNVFVPINRYADLTTQLEEIENQLLAQRQERKPSQQSGPGDFMKAPAFEATTASKERQLYEPDPPSIEDPSLGTAAAAIYEGERSLLTSISSKIAYMKDLKASYENLSWEAMELWALKDAIETEISRYTIRPATRRWIARVKMMEREVGELETRYKKEQTWRLVYLWVHSNLMRKDLVEKCKQVSSLNLKRGELVADLPEPVRKSYAPKIEDNSSLHKYVHDILSYLEDNDIRKIGVWGRVGAGKSTIMQNLNNHEAIAKMFDIVVWVTVSKEWSIEKLQEEIMQQLKLKKEGIVDMEENVQRIFEELQGKKYLILLDEVCHIVDLDKIIMGIHNNQNDYKVVLASRYHRVCYDMRLDELIYVKRLSPDDAWNMFRATVGHLLSFPSIASRAMDVVKQCDGSPLLIDRVARTFRKKGRKVSLWEDGLNSLRRIQNIDFMDKVLVFLKFCYDNLDSEAKKASFLYCALFSEELEIHIDYLLECWRIEGFIHGENVFRDAQDKAYAILDDLINLSLLERSEKGKCVKMNKVVRNLALKILLETRDANFLVQPHEGLQETPKREKWKRASRISLMDNNLCILPETVDGLCLLTLFLQRNKNLIAIPEFFFESMCSLRVLDLQGTRIKRLPSSLSNLICLRGLYLNSCINLTELPTNLEELVHLDVLDIRETKISLHQIGSLVWLKCLRVSISNFGMGNHMQKQQGSVSKFVSLEEFSIDVNSSKGLWEEVAEAITEEVATLKKLSSLQFCFPQVECLKLFVVKSPVWKKISHFAFQFSVGHNDSTHSQILESVDYSRFNCLKLVNGGGVDLVISEVLRNTHVLGLINYRGVSALSDFGSENMDHILACLIEGCNEIETIINGNGTTKGVLECLEHLHINNVPRLKCIWQGRVYVRSLDQLTTLTLTKCPQLKKIFSNGMIQQLHELQHLTVEECHQIEEIIMESENHGLSPSALPRLKSLVLLDLPELKSIWVDDSLEWSSLQWIKICMCSKLKWLPFSNANATGLRYIEGEESWWEALEWIDDSIIGRFHFHCIFN